nr:integrase, catalytic region, zinc finger, CCHC-type, peptidase aspartic, catalytic [Tanacetum cinerariifolium]
MKSLKEKVEDKLIKQDQSLQTVHMLCRPRPLYNELNKVAVGYKNPLCLTRTKQSQPTLYNGHEILKDNHAPAKVHNTEDTLEIAEITKKTMNAKMIDPECVTRKLKSKALKEQTKVSRPIKAFTMYPPNTPARLVPRVLPTKSQVKIHIFTLIQLFSDFDNTCKKRITPTWLTEGERGFEQTKECYLKEVIPFFKTLKDNFEGIQKALTKEIKKMKDIFERLEAEVAQLFSVATNSELNVARFAEMNVSNTSVEARCLALEAELANLRDKSHHENQKEVINHFSKLKVNHLNLQLKCQNLMDSIGNNQPTPDKDTLDFESVFVIGKMQASLQGKDNIIHQLRKQLSQLQATRSDTEHTVKVQTTDSQITKLTNQVTNLQAHNDLFRAEKDKVKQHYKELYDSIKITRAKHIEQVTKLTTENVTLKTSVNKAKVQPQVLTRAKHAIDVEPIVPRLRNNRDAHLDFFRHLKESVEIIRDIVEKAKVVRLLDRSIVSACRYTKHSLELLEYAIGTCPQGSQQRAKKLTHTPLIRNNQVTVAKPSDMQDSNPHIHVVTVKPQKTNVPVPHSTRVKGCPKASGSQPKSNPKTNRITPVKGVNKLPVEDQHRTNKSHLRTANRVDSSSRLKRTVIQIVLWYLDSGCSKHMTGDRPLLSAPAVAPSVRADEEIVPYNRWVQIGKSNCSLDLDKKQSNLIFKIAVDLLMHTNFHRAFTASTTIPSIYIQQFWDTIQYDKKAGNYRCQMDEQWFVLTKDTLREALQITPINNNQAFVAPPSAESIHTFIEDKRNLSRHTTGKKKATLILIPSIRFTKLIIYHLQRRHKFHPRSDSLLHLSNDEPVLGYLKFSAKGTKREVFRVPIPGSLITADIRKASYYQEYQENVAKHRNFLAGETGSAQDSPTPKPAKPARKPMSTAQKAPPMPSVSTLIRKPRSSSKSVDASEAEEVPTVGPLLPVVIRESESGKYQPLPEVPGKGKAKVTEEQVAHDLLSLQKAKKKNPVEQYIFQRRIFEPDGSSLHDKSPYAVLGQSDSEEESKKVLIGATEGGNDEDQAGPDPGAQAEGQAGKDADTLDEGQAGSNPDEMSEGQAGPDPGNARNEEQSIPSPLVHTGSDLEHMDLDIVDVSPQPSTEQLDEGFIATAYPKVQESLKLAVEEQVFDKHSDVDKNAETKVESMVNVPIQQAMSSISISPMTSPIIDLSSRPVSPKVHQQFKATTTNTTTTTTTVPPPQAQQQSNAEFMMVKRIGELEHIMANLIQVNKDMEERLDKHGARLHTLEQLDIPQQVSIAISEVVTDAVDWAMKAPLRNRFRDLSEANIKEILHQRMWEIESYKTHEDHSLLFEAFEKSMNRDHSEELAQDLAEARKKKKKRRESPKTPPGSPPHYPPHPPPPTGPSGHLGAHGASGSS